MALPIQCHRTTNCAHVPGIRLCSFPSRKLSHNVYLSSSEDFSGQNAVIYIFPQVKYEGGGGEWYWINPDHSEAIVETLRTMVRTYVLKCTSNL